MWKDVRDRLTTQGDVGISAIRNTDTNELNRYTVPDIHGYSCTQDNLVYFVQAFLFVG